MRSVSQKIRTGVLELRTPNGPLYVNPSFWERLYLLWIFRNFRSLSRQVLSLRQQRVIDRLCRTGSIIEVGRVARVNILGAIENARVIPGRGPALPVAGNNLLEIPARKQPMPLASAVGAPVVTISNKTAEHANKGKSTRLHAHRVTEIFTRQRTSSGSRQASLEPKLSSGQRRQQHRQWLEWAMAATLAGVLFGVLLYVRELRPLPLPSLSRHSIATQPGPVPQQAPTASSVAPTSSPATAPVLAASTNSSRQETVHSALGVRRRPVVEPESSSTTRIQLSGAPEHSFIYPEAPNSVLTGTVDLKAVIGSDGAVKHVDILSGKPALAHAAIQAVRNWRYAVPQNGGQAVEAETRVVISFIGDDAVSISFPQSRN